MPLPLNTETTIGGVAVVVKSVPEKASGLTQGETRRDPSPADMAVSAYAGSPSGSSNYNNRPKGLKLPDFSGLDKALGYLGTAQALLALGNSIYQTVKDYKFDPGNTLSGKIATEADKKITWWMNNGQDGVAPDSLGVGYGSGTGDNRVKLYTDFAVFEPNPYFEMLKDTAGLVFPYTPSISITHKANYTNTEGIVHTNFPFQSYKSSQIEDITIQAEFTVQNNAEGQYWLAANHFLRTSTKMFYGNSTPAGFPPVVCYLVGYGNEIIPNLPVVVKSYQVDFKDNVNYMTIESKLDRKQQFVPMQSTFTVTVSPMYNRVRARTNFNLQEYASGKLLGF